MRAAFSIIAILLVAILIAGCSSQDRNLTLIVSAEDPERSVAESVQSALEDSGYSITLEVAAAPADVVRAIQLRTADLAVSAEPNVPIEDVVTLAPLYPQILHVLHNRSTSPSNFADLIRDANVYAGPAGGAAHRLLALLLADFGVTPDQFRLLDNTVDIRPDVYFIFDGLLSTARVRELAGYQLFSFADQDDVNGGAVADGIALRYHNLMPLLLPKGTYSALHRDAVVTLSVRSVLIGHPALSDDVAFDIASRLYDSAHEIALSYPVVTGEPHYARSNIDLVLPLHRAAKRFLNQDEPAIVERYADVLALAITIIITLLSGGVGVYRWRMQAKKDRMDAYNSELLSIQAEMESMNTNGGLRAGRKRAMDVQRKVIGLLINERVAADTSLMAFLSLSNQVIADFDRRIRYELSGAENEGYRLVRSASIEGVR